VFPVGTVARQFFLGEPEFESQRRTRATVVLRHITVGNGMGIAMKVHLLMLAMLCALATSSFAAANPFDDATAAYERGDYVQAIKLFRQLAAQGHQWAQRRLGSMYAEGKGVPQDYQEAVRWYRLAAAQGYAPAQSSLGLAYEKGEGVPQDYREAVKWYRFAAAQGNEIAQLNLGEMYSDGSGVRQDFVRAHMWFTLAAAASSGDSGDAAIKNRDSIAAKMTAEQIGTAQEMARRCQESKFKNCD
jgi:tetratricopeptide (TPR) repeat protein